MTHLRLKREDCNDLAKVVEEYFNVGEDLVIGESNGFKIMNTNATRGEPKLRSFRNSENHRLKIAHAILFLLIKLVSTK